MAAKWVGVLEDLILGEIRAGSGMDFEVRTPGACDDLGGCGCKGEDVCAVCYVCSAPRFAFNNATYHHRLCAERDIVSTSNIRN